MDLRGYLHSNGNNCTGKSLGLFAYRTSKGVMLIKSTDALIHFDYTRYFHYYRIREVPGSPLFHLCFFVSKLAQEARIVTLLILKCLWETGLSFKLRKNTS